MSHNNRSRRGKRRQPVEQHEEETVDDLAYAASFAMMGPPTTTLPTTTKDDHGDSGMGEASEPDGEGDNNDGDEEIDIESDSGDDSENSNDDNPEKPISDEIDENPENEKDDDDDDDDDDEDHEDFVKAIAAMEEDVIEEEGVISKASLKTQHEVDAYNTPFEELEQHLDFRLSVDLLQATTKPRKLQPSDLKCAGTIKHHMAEDRTIVIESNPPVRGASLNPLDEGTLLLMKGEEGLSSSSNNNNNNKNQSLVPLGRIFETFGPVTRPLYTIRLPEPIDPPKEPAAATAEKTIPQVTPTNPDGCTETDNTDTIQKSDEAGPNNNNNEDDIDKKETDTTALPPPAPAVDHWGPNGKYSQLIQAKMSSSVPVYFVEDEAKLIDTDMILRKSGKGCDASNVYDEEVNNKEEMYYSDDEKERQAKSRRKASRNQQSQQQPDGSRHVGARGFHQPTTPAGFHALPMPPAPMPQGFHQPPPAAAYYGHGYPPPPPPPAAATYQQYPNYGGYPGGSNPPPPPPPPGGQGRSYYQAPNNNSGPPPAYQY
ncbi:unnamed protein product [Cylindrotheca closterium]|uniref:Uncharacterized protein n=1 Tax=Cylindrotheca closterium TaxID=2856 RepID=A0AAD2CVD9_9STRA|nr:unnamed protein product [Cylindrotheca closterium]